MTNTNDTGRGGMHPNLKARIEETVRNLGTGMDSIIIGDPLSSEKIGTDYTDAYRDLKELMIEDAKLRAEIAEKDARIRELESALKPFAAVLEVYTKCNCQSCKDRSADLSKLARKALANEGVSPK